jgi:SAM-dependent methyltransferase
LTYDFEHRMDEYGATPEGVGWGSLASQQIRFSRILDVIPASSERNVDILDIGCGYGGLVPFLEDNNRLVRKYVGLDIHKRALDETMNTLSAYNVENIHLDIVEKDDPVVPFWKSGKHDVIDYVFSSGVLQHCDEHATVIKTIARGFNLCKIACMMNMRSAWQDFPAKDHLSVCPQDILYWLRPLTRRMKLDHGYMPHDMTLTLYKGDYP